MDINKRARVCGNETKNAVRGMMPKVVRLSFKIVTKSNSKFKRRISRLKITLTVLC